MSKIVIAVLVLAVVGYFVFFNNKNKDANTENKNASSENISSDEENTNIGSGDMSEESFEESTNLLALMKKGGNYECNVEHHTEIGISNGVVYIAGEKIRGDFKSLVEVPGLVSMDVESHMIGDGESMYTWTSLSNEGYKTPVVVATKSNSNTETISFEDNLDYKCKSWSVDVSKFLIPTNITFKTS